MGARSRHAFEVRKAVERHVYFAGRSAVFEAVDVFEKVGGKMLGLDELVERESGIDAGGNCVGINFVAVRQDDALGPAIFDDDLSNGSLGTNLDSGFAGSVANSV